MYDEFEARYLWLAAFLVANGCQFVRAVPISERNCHYIFKDTDGTCVRLLREWRQEAETALVHGPTFVHAYQQLIAASKVAHAEEIGYGQGRQAA